MPKERKLYIADLSALNRNENGFIFVLVVFRSGLGDCFGFTLNVTDRILMWFTWSRSVHRTAVVWRSVDWVWTAQ